MNSPTRGDWVSEIKKWINEYEIATTFEEVKNMNKKQYEKSICEKVQQEAFQYLKNKIKSKGSTIDYGTRLAMQNYLKPNNVLTFQDQKEIFAFRSEMNELNYNFKGLKEDEKCVCAQTLNNIHLFQCKILNNSEYSELKYEDFLNGTLHQKKKTLNIMKKNMETFRNITLAARADI